MPGEESTKMGNFFLYRNTKKTWRHKVKGHYLELPDQNCLMRWAAYVSCFVESQVLLSNRSCWSQLTPRRGIKWKKNEQMFDVFFFFLNLPSFAGNGGGGWWEFAYIYSIKSTLSFLNNNSKEKRSSCAINCTIVQSCTINPKYIMSKGRWPRRLLGSIFCIKKKAKLITRS